jgi:hypothetical protein
MISKNVSDPATQVGQGHAATGVLLVLGTNNHQILPENATENQFKRLLDCTSQTGRTHWSDRSLLEHPDRTGELPQKAPALVRPV